MHIINSNLNTSTNFHASKQISYTLANQARMMTSVIQEVNPNLQILQKAVKSSGAKQALAALKDLIGIEQIFKEGGMSFKLDGKVINIISPQPFVLKLREQNPDKRKDFKLVEIANNNIEKMSGFSPKSPSVETFLASLFEKLDFPLLQLRRYFNRPEVSEVLKKISPKAVLDKTNIELVNQIKSLFEEIHERISSISVQGTLNKIKYSYPNIVYANHGPKQFDFVNIGYEKKDYSVNIVSKKTNEEHLVIKISNGTDEKNIIIDHQYRVLKEKNFGKVYNLGLKTDYYTQSEIDSPVFKLELEILKQELEKYNEYLKTRITELNKSRELYSTGEIGTLDKKTLTLIRDIIKQFDGCKAKMLKIKDASKKKAFKDKYEIETRMSSPSLIFKNVNELGESVHLSFPIMSGVRCMKIIIEKQNGNIGKSFFVNDDKLVKFKATTLGRSKRGDSKINYHSQEEIESSGLKELLQILQQRLKVIPKSE